MEILQKEWLTPTEVEAEFSISCSTLSKMRMKSNPSTLEFSKFGGFVLYPRAGINRFLKEHIVSGLDSKRQHL